VCSYDIAMGAAGAGSWLLAARGTMTRRRPNIVAAALDWSIEIEQSGGLLKIALGGARSALVGCFFHVD